MTRPTYRRLSARISRALLALGAAALTLDAAFLVVGPWLSVMVADAALEQHRVDESRALPFGRHRRDVGATPAQEVAYLARRIDRGWEELLRGRTPNSVSHFFLEVGDRLSVFEERFGVELRDAPGGSELERSAARRLATFEERFDAEAVATDTYAMHVRHTLLLLAGRLEEADDQILGYRVRDACANVRPTRLIPVRRRQSELRARQGRLDDAIFLIDRIFVRVPWAYAMAESDIVHARMGLLLIQHGRVGEGVAELQRVVDLCPGTVGEEIAARELLRRGILVEPSFAWLRARYDLADDRHHRCSPQHAIIAHGFPGSVDWAVERLRDGSACNDVHYAAAIADLRDERAIPILERMLGKGIYDGDAREAARGLIALGRTDVLVRLFRYDFPQWIWLHRSRLEDVHDALADIFGSAPPIDDWESPDAFFARWRSWVEER